MDNQDRNQTQAPREGQGDKSGTDRGTPNPQKPSGDAKPGGSQPTPSPKK